jgi:CRISPR-associated endonuclease/helicase Cas3
VLDLSTHNYYVNNTLLEGYLLKTIYTYWGKSSRSQHQAQYHLLIYHLIDVYNVAHEILMKDKALYKKMHKQLKLSRKEICYIAALHDVGKVLKEFQQKNKVVFDTLNGTDINVNNNKVHHGSFSAFALTRLSDCVFSGDFEYIRQWGIAVGSHHGVIISAKEISPSNTSYCLSLMQTHDIIIKIAEELAKVLEIHLPISVKKIIKHNLLVFTGLTSVSDWIASNIKYFPMNSTQNLVNYVDISKNRAQLAVKATGIVKYVNQSDRKYKTVYDVFTGFMLNDLQKEMIKLPLSNFTIIESATASGKSEAMLLYVERMLRSDMISGAYIAMPTMATGNNLYIRIIDYLNLAYHENTYSCTLTHSNMLRYEDSSFRSSWMDNTTTAFLSPFAIGTVDQLLVIAMQVKYNFLKFFALQNKVVVFDEIHSYDIYMNTLIKQALCWLGKYNIPVVLLSATMTTELKNELLEAYTGQSYQSSYLEYPLISYLHSNKLQEVTIPEKEIQTRTIHMRTKFTGAYRDYKVMVEDAIEYVNKGNVFFILNTVKRVQEFYTYVKQALPNYPVYILHSKYTELHRKNKELEITNIYGKDSNNIKNSILIGTQVLEQSLNISADYMFFDVASMDSIIQRLGRILRFCYDRHVDVHVTLYMLKFYFDKEGGSNIGYYVYDAFTIMRTLQIFQNYKNEDGTIILQFPEQIRNLLEKSSDTVSLDNDVEYGGNDYTLRLSAKKIEYHRNQKLKRNEEIRHTAHTIGYTCEDDVDIPSNNYVYDENNKYGVKYVSTRYGAPSIKCILLKKVKNKYYTIHDQIIDIDNSNNYYDILVDSSISIVFMDYDQFYVRYVDKEVQKKFNQFSRLKNYTPLVINDRIYNNAIGLIPQ